MEEEFTLTIPVLSLKGCLQTSWLLTHTHCQQDDVLTGGSGEVGVSAEKAGSDQAFLNKISCLFSDLERLFPCKSQSRV